MQAIAVGLSKMTGTSAKTGAPYEMLRMTILVPNGSVATAKYNKFGLGYEPMDLPVAESAFAKMGQLSFPCQVDLVMDHQPRAGKVEAVVAGFNGSPVHINVDGSGTSKA